MGSVGAHLESTLSSSEEKRFKNKHMRLILTLAKRYGFSREAMESIFLIYYKIQKTNGNDKSEATKGQVREIFHKCFDITSESTIDLIYMVYFNSMGNYISVEDFIKVIALFLRGTPEEKANHCFKCYTSSNFENCITREMMYNQMKSSIITASSDEDSEEVVRDFLDILLKKMDDDRDSKISYNEYRDNINLNPLLMEFLGQVLPSRKAVHSFLTTITEFRGKI